MRALLITLCLFAAPGHAWDEPARGTQTRSDMLSAIRPHIEWALGAPVQFVVSDLRVSGNVGFASVTAQRPGGGAIDLYATPAYQRGEFDPEMSDGASIQALLQKSGDVWVATHHAIGATDVWYSWDGFCPIWQPVLSEICSN